MRKILQYRTLGGVELFECAGSQQRRLSLQPKQLAILAYLAGSKPDSRPHARDSLLRIFWPDADQGSARGALRQAIYEIRRLCDGLVRPEGRTSLRLDCRRLSYDVWSFQAAIDTGDLERAIAVRRGPFLDGFFLTGTPEFEQWVDAERSALDRAYHHALASVSRSFAERHDLVTGVAFAHQWAREEPYSSRAITWLMQLLELAGDRAGALRAAELYASRLKKEIGTEPEGHVLALADRIRSAPVVAAAQGARAPADRSPSGSDPALPSRPVRQRDEGVAAAAGLPRKHRLRVSVTAVVTGLLLVAAASLLVVRSAGRSDLISNRVLVLPFENRTNSDTLESLGTILSDWIAQELLRVEGVEVVPTSDVLRRRQASDDGPTPGDQVPSLSEHFKAHLVVSGSYHLERDSLALTSQLVDATRGVAIATFGSPAAPLGAPGPAIDQLRDRIGGAVALQLHLRRGTDWSRSGTFPSIEAYQTFLAGLQAFSRGQIVQALGQFRRTTRADSTFTPALYMTAVMHSYLGQWAEIDTLARSMHRIGRSSFDHWTAAYWGAVAVGDRAGAVRASREVSRLAPGGGVVLQAGFEALQFNRPSECIKILEALDPARNPGGAWTRPYWWNLATAQHALREHRAELRTARRARRQFPEVGFMLFLEARALAAQHEVRDIDELVSGMLSLQATELVVSLAEELDAHGHAAGAQEVLNSLVKWYRSQLAARLTAADDRHVLADALWLLGRDHEAKTAFAELVAERPDRLDLLGHLGVLYAELGERDSALQVTEQLIRTDGQYLFGKHLAWAARVAATLGEAADAVGLLRQALSEGLTYQPLAHSGYHSIWHSDWALRSLRRYDSYRELMRPKG